MSNHTPGPWRHEPATRHDQVNAPLYCERIYAIDPGPENDFTVGWAHDADRATRTANAQLIANAPRLLEALKALVSLFDDGDREYDTLTEARAAVAAAEGTE